MPEEIKLKSGENVKVRAQCSNPKCKLLLISDNDNLVTSENERTIHSNEAIHKDDLRNIPYVLCVHCR